MPEVNTGTMQEFLDRFSKTLPKDEVAIMYADQAGWHGARELRVPDNVILLASARLLARAQSGRAHLALPQGALPLAPPARRLRGHRRRGLCGMEQADRRGWPHHLIVQLPLD